VYNTAEKTMGRKEIFFMLFIFLGFHLQHAWIAEESSVEGSTVGIYSSFMDDQVFHLGIFYTYQISTVTEAGWGFNYYNYSSESQPLKGKTVTLGPMWGHTIRLGHAGLGFRFSMNFWISVYSSLTTTEAGDDNTKFTAELDPQLLMFQSFRLGKNIRLFPAVGVAATLTYMQRSEAEAMNKGLVETRLIITLPIKINTGKKSFILVEPVSRIFLYSNRNRKVENTGIKISYLF
jgi:hypothetical protein